MLGNIVIDLPITQRRSVAMGLPWLLRNVGQDPAFAAGPLATIIKGLALGANLLCRLYGSDLEGELRTRV
jgi:hypothetical protein